MARVLPSPTWWWASCFLVTPKRYTAEKGCFMGSMHRFTLRCRGYELVCGYDEFEQTFNRLVSCALMSRKRGDWFCQSNFSTIWATIYRSHSTLQKFAYKKTGELWNLHICIIFYRVVRRRSSQSETVVYLANIWPNHQILHAYRRHRPHKTGCASLAVSRRLQNAMILILSETTNANRFKI